MTRVWPFDFVGMYLHAIIAHLLTRILTGDAEKQDEAAWPPRISMPLTLSLSLCWIGTSTCFFSLISFSRAETEIQ